jgi:hypothetical protein
VVLALTPSSLRIDAAARNGQPAIEEPTITCGATGSFTDRDAMLNVFDALSAKEREAAGDFGPQIVVFRRSTWARGATLRVRFLDDEASAADILKIANEWTTDLTVHFVLVTSGPSHIRVKTTGIRLSSLIGKQPESTSDRPTMELGGLTTARNPAERRAFILHEFGHALGALHEHQRLGARLTWQTEVVYKYFEDKYGMSRVDIYRNVMRPFDESSAAASTPFDRQSVMMYPILKEFTVEGFIQPWNSVLSDYDKQLARELYGSDKK